MASALSFFFSGKQSTHSLSYHQVTIFMQAKFTSFTFILVKCSTSEIGYTLPLQKGKGKKLI